MKYKKGDTLQIEQGSCIVLAPSINALVFFEEMYDTQDGWEHPIYSISAEVDAIMGAFVWENEHKRKKNLELQIFHKVLYGDTKVAILDSEVYGKLCSRRLIE